MSPNATATKTNACYCYIIVCSDGTFYTGWTTDLKRRVKTHNAGRGARYTRARRPVKLVYHEAQPDPSSAMKRERAIKKMRRVQKQKLIQNGKIKFIKGKDALK